MSRRPIWFQLPPDLEAELVRTAREERLTPWRLMVVVLEEYLGRRQNAGFLYVSGLQIPLQVMGGRGPAEPLPHQLLVGPTPLTPEVWQRLRDGHGARIYCSIPGLLEALGIEPG